MRTERTNQLLDRVRYYVPYNMLNSKGLNGANAVTDEFCAPNDQRVSAIGNSPIRSSTSINPAPRVSKRHPLRGQSYTVFFVRTLTSSPHGSFKRGNALASMRNVEAEFVSRGPGLIYLRLGTRLVARNFQGKIVIERKTLNGEVVHADGG